MFFVLLLVTSSGAWAGAQPVVRVLSIDDHIITPTVADLYEREIRRAERDGVTAVLIELNTPGGLLRSTQRIVELVLNAKVPIITYVSPDGGRAASAGVFMTMASHVAAMAPATRIGAAHPVNFGDAESPQEAPAAPESVAPEGAALPATANPMDEKLLSDTLAWAHTIAVAHQRNADWMREAVVDSRSSTAEEAQRLGAVDTIADSRAALLAWTDGREVQLAGAAHTLQTANAIVEVVTMSWTERILQALADPQIAYILMMLGFYGLLFEITHPGTWISGIAGTLCILLALYAFDTLPTNMTGAAFIAGALALFVAEAFVTSYGLLSVAGAACLFFGSIMLIDSPAQFMQISYDIIIPIVVVSAAISLFLASLVLRAQRAPVQSGARALVGMIGTVERELHPTGTVAIAGELWTAEATENIAVGERVRICEVQGLSLRVERVHEPG